MEKGFEGKFKKDEVHKRKPQDNQDICLGAYVLSIQNREFDASLQHFKDITKYVQEPNVTVIDNLAEAFTAAVTKAELKLESTAKQFGKHAFHNCDNCPISMKCSHVNKRFAMTRSQMLYMSFNDSRTDNRN